MSKQTIALITGVSRDRGLGFETAKQLAQKNIEVIISARDLEKAKNLSKILNEQSGVNTSALSIDTTNSDSVKQAAQAIEKKYGKLDILINNAGGFYEPELDLLTVEASHIQKVFDTNLLGAIRMIQTFVPLLRKSDHGRIVNVSSGAGTFNDQISGMLAHPDNSAIYSLSKLTLTGLTIQMAHALKKDKILVNAICPGFVATYPGTEEWGARPVPEGASGIVWAALLPDDGPSGGFFRDGKKISI